MIILPIKRDWLGKKVKLTFYFQKNLLHVMAVLDYLPKLKQVLGLAFGAHFMHDLSIKIFLI